jgi:hypothetical protein
MMAAAPAAGVAATAGTETSAATADTLSAKLSRRSFVTLVAAGGVALLAPSGVAAAAERRKHKAGAPPVGKPLPTASAPSASQKEFDRQRTGTLATLKTLRAHALPPGGDLPVVFKPLRVAKRGR